tara:strand:- start:1896 stop:2120 length:225 start_codon:yes stop_codon:yes gene_type:complete
MLEELNQQLRLHVVMQWVAIEDALPPVELDVLVWDEFNVYITNRLDSNDVVWDESTQILDGVTHWMYLPEPPCA